MEDFYLFLSSKDSIQAHPNNTYCNMKIDLPTPISLPESDEHYWTVALLEISITDITKIPTSTVVLCDLLEASYIRDSLRPVLRIIAKDSIGKGSLFIPYYHRINRETVSTISIDIVDSNLNPITPQSDLEVLACTLHFQYIRRI
jgi:hypothetical protein